MKMYIEKVNHDENYPYIIHDGWDGKLCMSAEGLKELKKLIEKELKKLDKPKAK